MARQISAVSSDDLSLKAVDLTKAQKVYYQGWLLPFIISSLFITLFLHLLIANVQPNRVSYYSPRNTRKQYCNPIKNQFTAVCLSRSGDKNCQIVQNVTMTSKPSDKTASSQVLPMIMCRGKSNKESALDCHSDQMRVTEKWHNFACGHIRVRNYGIFVSSANRNSDHAVRWSDISSNYSREKTFAALVSLIVAAITLVCIVFILYGTVPPYGNSIIVPPSHVAHHDIESESTSISMHNNPSRTWKSHVKAALTYNSILMPDTDSSLSLLNKKNYSLRNGPSNGGTFDPQASTWKLMASSTTAEDGGETCVWNACAERRLIIWLPFIVRECIKLCGVVLLGLVFILLAKGSYVIRIYLVAFVPLLYLLLALYVIFHVGNNIAQKLTTEYMVTDRRIIITRFNMFHLKREILFLELKHVVQVNYNPGTNMVGIEAETGHHKRVYRTKNILPRRFVLEGIAGSERVAKLIKGETERYTSSERA